MRKALATDRWIDGLVYESYGLTEYDITLAEVYIMDITPYDKPLKWLIEGVETTDIVLPEFQRSFVWRRNDIEDLLISILKGYYIGSFILLCIDRDNIPFAPRPVEGLEKSLRHPQWMLLDGQQRLTSLYYVFHAPEQVTLRNTSYPYCFFLDLNKLEDGDIDNAISSERSDWCKDQLEKHHQFETLIIPFTELHSSRWPKWLEDYEIWFYAKLGFSEETFQQRRNTIDRWKEAIDNLYKHLTRGLPAPIMAFIYGFCGYGPFGPVPTFAGVDLSNAGSAI